MKEKTPLLAACVALVAACAAPIDTDREIVDTGSFGTTVVTLACKRIAYLEDLADGDGVVDVRGDAYRDVCRFGVTPPADAPASLKALIVDRDPLIAAVDAAFPADYLPDLQTYLTSTDFLALYDDGTTVGAIDALVKLLVDFADDDELTSALERLDLRLGYVPVAAGAGAVRTFADYPDLHSFLLVVTDAITEGGPARQEFDNLVAALSMTMRHAAPAADADRADRTGALAVDLLMSEQPLLGTNRPRILVRRDDRGLARVAFIDGGLPGPFADANGDGLADADDDGHYLGAAGAMVDAPPPFAMPDGDDPTPWPYRDADGRALASDGGPPLYEYVDLDRTVLAALARDGLELFDPLTGTALDLLRGASALLGPRQEVTRDYDGEPLTYRGHDTSASALLDMIYGAFVVLRDPRIDDTLALARVLFVDHEAEAARLAEAIIQTARLGDELPDGALVPGSTFYDDLMPVVRRILAEPGLAEDLLRALDDPQTAELGLRFGSYMKYKDSITIDPVTQGLVGSLRTPVDRSQPDSGFNRSLMQRLLHLINDSNHTVLCNKQDAVVRDPFIGIPIASYDECDLLRIDNLAVFYLQSIAYAKDSAGNVIYDDVNGSWVPRPKARFPFTFNNALIESIVDDDLLESQSGIAGFRFHPTPAALDRTLFLDPMPPFLADAMDPPRCNDGDLFTAAHGGTLMVWELDGFYDQIRPIVQVFADHDQEQLFVDLMVVLHDHWPSPDSVQHQQSDPNGHGYAKASDIHSWEPYLVALLERRQLLDAIVYSAPVLNGLQANGRAFADIATGAGRYLLTPQPGLTDRLGNTTTTEADGVTPVDVLSPWHVLADAWQRKRDQIAAAGGEGEAWQRAVSGVVDVLPRADAVAGLGWRFRNPRFRGVTVALIDFLRARIAAHDAAGDRAAWLGSDLPGRIEDSLASPVFAGAADFVLSLQASPAARAAIEGLVAYLMDEASSPDTFQTAITAVADVLQLCLDDRDIVAIDHAVGDLLRPDRGFVAAHLAFVKAARHADTGEALTRLMRNLYALHRPGHTAVGDLVDGIKEVHRSHPFDDHGRAYKAADYRSLFLGVAYFLDDNRHGMRKFVAIVQGRNL